MALKHVETYQVLQKGALFFGIFLTQLFGQKSSKHVRHTHEFISTRGTKGTNYLSKSF